jgi:23S rRNA maturation-related 3'-5' exoribonuclease YhaM
MSLSYPRNYYQFVLVRKVEVRSMASDQQKINKELRDEIKEIKKRLDDIEKQMESRKSKDIQPDSSGYFDEE